MFINIIIAILIFIHIFFILAAVRKKFDIIDIGWGLGILLAVTVAYLHHPVSFKNAVVLLVVAIWALRLSLYLFGRNSGKGEDPRYTTYREKWAPHSNLQAYFKVFLFQGLLMIVVSLPATVGLAQESHEINFIQWIGLVVWLMGLIFETWADYHLSWFKKQPENKGKVCTSGPWSLCRFPNYAGEIALWYGIYLLNFEFSIAWTIIGPFTIHFMILKVTGIPPLEERYKNRPSYHSYAAKVPRLIPFTRP